MATLRQATLLLAHAQPELRRFLVPLLRKHASGKPELKQVRLQQFQANAEFAALIRREYAENVLEGVPVRGFTLMTSDASSGDVYFVPQADSFSVKTRDHKKLIQIAEFHKALV
jgi:hypothetical protein